MDLFIINRHEENNPIVNEEENLKKVLERVEKRKAARAARKHKKKELIQNVKEERSQKRKLISKVTQRNGTINEQNDFIDEALCEPSDNVKETNVKQRKLDSSSIDGFMILGADKFEKKSKVKRVLPKWLSNATVISVNLQNLEKKVSSIKELDKKLRTKLKDNDIKYFFPVQAEVIPWLLKSNKDASIIFPRDICVSAPTGSGKTLAYTLPVIQALMHYKIKKIRALVILPTQDLAVQVFKTFKKYTEDTPLDVSLITGKTPFEHEQNKIIVKNEAYGFLSKIDILVCTAGRLVDHMKSTEGFDLKSLEFLIIDEADRVLDNVQHDWLHHLDKHINNEDSMLHGARIVNLATLKKRRPPQKLLFSATLSQDPEKLQKLSLFQPKLFTSVIENNENITEETVNTNSFIGKYTTPKELTEKYVVCSMDLKPLVLYEFIKTEKLTKTMVFTHSVESTHRLAILLKSLFKNDRGIEEVSSNLEIKNRNLLTEKFTKGDIDILVCTDAFARGIDLPGVQCVISYSAPKHLKTYIHRAGRTARAGENGLAVTILHKSQFNKYQELLKQADKNNIEEIKIDEENLEPLTEQYKEALEDLKKAVIKEDKEDLIKMKSSKKTKLKRNISS